MTQPVAYVPATAFITYQATQSWFPGQNLDVELNALKATMDQIRTNLTLIQKDDGTLQNGIVGLPQLSAALQVVFGATPAVSLNSGLAVSVPTGLGLAIGTTQNAAGTTTTTGPGVTYTFPYLNLFQIASDSVDASSPNNAFDGWQFNHTMGGSTLKGARQSLDVTSYFTSASNASNTNRNYVSLVGQMNVVTSDGGTANTPGNTKGSFFGGNLVVRSFPAAVNLTGLIGLEVDVANAGTALTRFGVHSASYPGNNAPTNAGVTYDAAYSVCSVAGTSNIGWFYGMLLSNIGARAPLDATNGIVIGTDGSANTIKTFIDSGNYAFTTAFMKGPNGFTVGPTGDVIVGNGAANHSLIVNGGNSGSAGAVVQIQNAGTISAAVGNYSDVLGGAYDARALLYGGTGLVLYTGGNPASVVCSSFSSNGPYQINGVQVVNSRVTGWNAPTTGGGGLLRGTFDTGATLLQTAETLAALITDLRTHGLINT